MTYLGLSSSTHPISSTDWEDTSSSLWDFQLAMTLGRIVRFKTLPSVDAISSSPPTTLDLSWFLRPQAGGRYSMASPLRGRLAALAASFLV